MKCIETVLLRKLFKAEVFPAQKYFDSEVSNTMQMRMQDYL